MTDLPLPTEITTGGAVVQLRTAVLADLEAIVGLLADDPVRAARGDVAAPGDMAAYARGMQEMRGSMPTGSTPRFEVIEGFPVALDHVDSEDHWLGGGSRVPWERRGLPRPAER